MGHTKGEWYLELRPSDNVRRVRCASEMIADVFGTNAEDKANAYLIAAAPELYEACKTVDLLLHKIDLPMPELHMTHIKIQDAIAKVKGD